MSDFWIFLDASPIAAYCMYNVCDATHFSQPALALSSTLWVSLSFSREWIHNKPVA